MNNNLSDFFYDFGLRVIGAITYYGRHLTRFAVLEGARKGAKNLPPREANEPDPFLREQVASAAEEMANEAEAWAARDGRMLAEALRAHGAVLRARAARLREAELLATATRRFSDRHDEPARLTGRRPTWGQRLLVVVLWILDTYLNVQVFAPLFESDFERWGAAAIIPTVLLALAHYTAEALRNERIWTRIKRASVIAALGIALLVIAAAAALRAAGTGGATALAMAVLNLGLFAAGYSGAFARHLVSWDDVNTTRAALKAARATEGRAEDAFKTAQAARKMAHAVARSRALRIVAQYRRRANAYMNENVYTRNDAGEGLPAAFAEEPAFPLPTALDEFEPVDDVGPRPPDPAPEVTPKERAAALAAPASTVTQETPSDATLELSTSSSNGHVSTTPPTLTTQE